MNTSFEIRPWIGGVAVAVGLILGGCESTSSSAKSPQVLSAQSTGNMTTVERDGPPRVMDPGRTAANVKFGRVLSATPTTIEGKRGLVGTLGGAAAGGMAVRPQIRTPGDLLMGTIGAVGGAVVGRATQEAMTRAPGQEITIGLENGDVAVVIQDAEEGLFREGDAVKIVQGPKGAYVTLATADDRIIARRARETAGQPAWYEQDEPGL